MEIKEYGGIRYVQSTITPPEGLVDKILAHQYTFFPYAEGNEEYDFWTGHMPYTGQIWDVVPETAVFLDYIKESVELWGFNLNEYFAKCWVVLVPKGQNVSKHAHHGSVSGYWILKDTDTTTFMEVDGVTRQFKNFDGNFMLFDSSVPHFNTFNKSDDMRVTLAFTVSDTEGIQKELEIAEDKLKRLNKEGVKENTEASLYTRQFDTEGNIVIGESYVPLV